MGKGPKAPPPKHGGKNPIGDAARDATALRRGGYIGKHRPPPPRAKGGKGGK